MSLPETYKALYSAPKKGEKPTIREVPLPKPGKDQVLVKIEFTPVNPTDIITMHSQLSPGPQEPKLVGSEGSGTIVALGEDLKTPFKVGDRVHVLGPGNMAQYLVANTDNIFPIQDNLSFEEAASHIINPGTVYYMAVLAERGNHKAVIHTAGSSALGRMLIRLLKQKGIKSINIVRRDDYTEELKKEGADYVLNSTAPDFEAKLKEIATKEQATMTVDAIGGDFSSKVLSAQPPNSILYVYGLLSGQGGINNISIGDLFQGKSITGLILTTYFNETAAKGERRKYFEEVHSLLPTVFKSSIQKIFKLEELEDSLAYYNENSSKGKILLRPN